jgi:hypothetical protein
MYAKCAHQVATLCPRRLVLQRLQRGSQLETLLVGARRVHLHGLPQGVLSIRVSNHLKQLLNAFPRCKLGMRSVASRLSSVCQGLVHTSLVTKNRLLDKHGESARRELILIRAVLETSDVLIRPVSASRVELADRLLASNPKCYLLALLCCGIDQGCHIIPRGRVHR